MSVEPPASDGASEKAAQVAAGSSIVLVGNLLNRGLRFVTSWALANLLPSAAVYGLYEAARTLVTILASFAPLGTDKGVVYFGARQRAAGDEGALRGTIQTTFIVAAIGGPMVALLGGAAAWGLGWEPVFLWMMPAVAVWSVLLAAVGTLRGLKDMRGQSLAYLVVLPLGMFASALLPLAGFGVEAVAGGFVAANVLALLVALPLVWRQVRHLKAPVVRSVGPLLRYSIPESFSSTLFRVNQWADTLMVWLIAGTADVGLYRAAVTLAMIGEVPAVAVNTMFQPVVAEMVQENNPEQLRRVVRIVTRWMVMLAAPIYLGIYVGIEVVLSAWKPEYASSADALAILLWGQAAYVLAVPVTALIPMSGRARLNLLNAGGAAGLNVALNAVMIPLWGIEGAATATGITLALWSAWRMVQVHMLMGVQAFGLRAIGLTVLFVALGLGAREATADAELMVQAAATGVSVLVFLVAAFAFGRTPGDAVVLDRVTAKLKRKLGLKRVES